MCYKKNRSGMRLQEVIQMKVIVCKDYDAMSKKAYEYMKECITSKKNAVLGLATGSTPVGLYKEMVADYKAGNTDYKDIVSYNLDEYVGIDRNHPESYYSFMHKNLFDLVDIKDENTHLPCGTTQADADAYEAQLQNANIDLQILGIGRNGHIGFNEPGTSFAMGTHVVDLTESTIEANCRFFDNDPNLVPKQALSMGIADIMKSKEVLVLASGVEKADAVKGMIEGSVTEECPASALQNHPNVIVIVDEAAASKLSK